VRGRLGSEPARQGGRCTRHSQGATERTTPVGLQVDHIRVVFASHLPPEGFAPDFRLHFMPARVPGSAFATDGVRAFGTHGLVPDED